MIKKILLSILIPLLVVGQSGCAQSIQHSKTYGTRQSTEVVSISLEDLDDDIRDRFASVIVEYFATVGFEQNSYLNGVLSLRKSNYHSDSTSRGDENTVYEYTLLYQKITTTSKLSQYTYLDSDFAKYLMDNLSTIGVSSEYIYGMECSYRYITDYKSITTNCDNFTTVSGNYIHEWQYTLSQVDSIEVVISQTTLNNLIWYILIAIVGIASFLIPYLIIRRKHIGD
ncbi:MAG: hypothetical protein J6Q52_01065 [Clostridia bacterium]|nr:hypothetical protein [Clostridia bacterium]